MSNFRRRVMASLACVLMACLQGCASVGAASGNSFSVNDKSPEAKLLGDYLVGRYAYNIDDSPARLTYYASAFDREPDNLVLGVKAVNAAISAGDEKAVRNLARRVNALSADEPLSRLVLGAFQMRSGRYSAAASRLQKQPDDPSLGVMMAMMEAWANQGAGKADTALEIFNSIEIGGYFDIIATLQKAQIYGQDGRDAEAMAAFERVQSSGVSPISMAIARARYQSAARDLSGALKNLAAFDSAVLGGVESGPIRTMLTELEAGRPAGSPKSAAQSASSALIDPAAEFFFQQRGYDAAEIYLRIALMLDPKNERARLWLGATLERMDRTADAQDVYLAVPRSSDYIVSSDLAYANLLVRSDKDDEAEAVLKRLVSEHPTFLVRQALGLSYLIKEDYAAALPYYNAMLETMTQADIEDNPTPLFHRGICLVEMDRFKEAIGDFQTVLEINPDHADALNYLGYSWVDRGENLDEAFEMIRKALKLEPNSGAITDSLGWAHYKLGQYSEARIHLEDAVALSPDSATIIDHLGDVYWKLGRFLEAGYQWERALDFNPTDKERARINAKLKGGLTAANDLP